MTRLFPLFIVTDWNGKVLQLNSIFEYVSAKIEIGAQITDHFISKHYQPVNTISRLTELNGNVSIPTGLPNISLKMFGIEIANDKILWVSSIILNGETKITDFPTEIKRFYQYDKIVEEMLSINSVRLSLKDAGTLYDKVTEKNKELNKAAKLYRRVVESVNDVVFETDATGKWTFLNSSWERVMEYDVAESLGKPFFDFLHPEDVKQNEELFAPLINREKTYCSHQIRYISKSGKIKFIKVYATLILSDDDSILGTAGTLQDITLQLEQKNKYELLSENISDLICIHTADGHYDYVSPSIFHIAGYDPEELIGRHPKEFVHPEDMAKLYREYNHKAVLEQDTQLISTYRFIDKAGNHIWMEASTNILSDGNEIKGYVVSSRNIEERKQAESLMIKSLDDQKQLYDQKSQMISLVSHEFRNPIAVMQLSSDILKVYVSKGDVKSNEFDRHLSIIDRELERLKESLNNALLIGKIESGSVVANKKKIRIESVIDEVTKRVQDGLKDMRAPEININGLPRHIYVDPMHISFILENMISNALKYSAGKPSPHIALDYRKDGFSVTVKDSGIGIPDSEVNKLFRSFYRASNTGTIPGTGLGLVIVKSFVEIHGGKVKIKSKQGQGTEIAIMIPDNV